MFLKPLWNLLPIPAHGWWNWPMFLANECLKLRICNWVFTDAIGRQFYFMLRPFIGWLGHAFRVSHQKRTLQDGDCLWFKIIDREFLSSIALRTSDVANQPLYVMV